jgi:uncharacterized coiled-coil protein SlyX
MKKRFTLTIMGLACFVMAGCQTPEERAMSQMEKQMHAQMEMMKRMQKVMAEQQKAMDKMVEQMDAAEK